MQLSQGHDRQSLCPKGLTRWTACAPLACSEEMVMRGARVRWVHLPVSTSFSHATEAHSGFRGYRAAQFLAVCSSSILAEALCLSSPFSGQPRQKRRVSEMRTSSYRPTSTIYNL